MVSLIDKTFTVSMLLVFCVYIIIFPLIIKKLWNYAIPRIFNLKEITYLESISIYLIFKLLTI